MKILITGACGMVGSYLVDYYYNLGINVLGTYFKPTTDIREIEGKAHLIECDIRYFNNLFNIIFKYKPEKIFHLAAQSLPTVSWIRPQETIDVNVNGTINVFESIKNIRKIDKNYDPVVIVACSSAEYGASLTSENVPIKEDAMLLPLHPYGVSKVAQDLLSYQYYVNDGIRVIRTRIFNTTGPRKINDVCSDFTKRAVLIEKGITDNKLKVGNLETYRAIMDVRDLVRALVLLSDLGKWGDVYNVSGSKLYQIREIVTIIREYISVPFELELDLSLLRPADEPVIYGDSSKLIGDTGWSQVYTLDETIKDMINYWRGAER